MGDAVGDVVEVLWGGWREGRQRKVASVRAGTPSGDTTRTPAAQTDILSPRLVHPTGRKNIKCAERFQAER